jgi:hypothetical protein
VHHIREEHSAELSEDLLDTVLMWSPVASIGLEACPLCDTSGPRDSPELIDHVLEHIVDFSLRSLPWADFTFTADQRDVDAIQLEGEIGRVERERYDDETAGTTTMRTDATTENTVETDPTEVGSDSASEEMDKYESDAD